MAVASAAAIGTVTLCTPVGAVPGTTRTRPMPAPSAWIATSYASIACHGIGACTAVGSHLGADTYFHPVADVQRGSAWAYPTTLTVPSGAVLQSTDNFGYRSVACPTQGNCLAVGTAFDPSPGAGVEPALVAQIHGTWGPATSSIPLPAGATMAELGAIWCRAGGACVLAGTAWSGTGAHHAFVDVQVAGVWQGSVTLPDPSPPGSHKSLVVAPMSISCTTTADCVVVGAVGPLASPSAHYGFAEVDRAGTWTATVIAPGATTRDLLASVSCASSTTCVAVGSIGPTLTSTGGLAPFSVTFARGRWGNELVLPWKFYAPETFGGSLAGVSCPSVRRCLAVGELNQKGAVTAPGRTGRVPVVYAMTDGVWTDPAISTTPAIHGRASAGAALDAITCTTAHFCEVVGATTPKGSSGAFPFSTVTEVYSRGTPPGAVAAVVVTRSHGRFDVSWRGPTTYGGSPIASYLVIARSPHEKTIQCLTVTRSCRLYRAVAHHVYKLDVTAINAARQMGPTRRHLIRAS